ncbi:sensor histidine kinase [Mumia sp. Pv 4-285]|uniref:sensor histidine kinase n=1 Tax=Mumia qirimensis TaxID=3234852 RepID=UPI00351CD864
MTRKQWAFDIALAIAVGMQGQAEAWWGYGETHRQGPLWAQSALYAVLALLLVMRRWRPLTCLVAMTAACVVEHAMYGSPEGFAVALAPLIATYTCARWLEWRRSWIALALAPVGWLAWSAFDPMNDSLADWYGSSVWMSPFVIAWLLGALVRSVRLNADQRRLAREQREAHAVAVERTRIARELHDVIGHSVSVMTVQASAVRRRLAPDQAVERRALETVESVGREALAEMRRMVGVLREDGRPGDREPPPGTDQLDRLLEKFRAAGLPVELTISGTPRSLAPGLDLTAYRLVQEGLTNALRHARNPRAAQVRMDYGETTLRLCVSDDGEPATVAHAAVAEAGSGLLGMRERVAVYGGELVARPLPDGGFELLATLPLEPA